MKTAKRAILVGILLAGALYIASPGTISLVQHRVSDSVRFDEKEWIKHIALVGGEKAYVDMVLSAQDLSTTDQHVLAHVFGGALYNESGLNGFSICDEKFQYGCFHQLIGQAIYKLGVETVAPALNTSCASRFGSYSISCKHGIGHGVLAYYGYEFGNLNSALSICEKYVHVDSNTSNAKNGCYDGAFMEYDFPEMMGFDELGHVKPRLLLSEGEIYGPCEKIQSEYRSACVFELPVWWSSVIHPAGERGITGVSAKMGEYCRGMKFNRYLSDLSLICIASVGHTIGIVADQDIGRALKMCDAVSHSDEENILCKLHAARRFSFASGEDLRDTCQSFGFKGNELEYCSVRRSTYIDNLERIKKGATERF